MKIYHKVEYWKGYIPSDKVHYNHIPFECYSLNNFGLNAKELNKEYRSRPQEEKNDFITKIKLMIKDTALYKEIVKDGYHQAYYLNFNFDTIQGFISR
ncbi:hypothetical protein CCP1ISM_50049 [Azospirillaceae bacterium]